MESAVLCDGDAGEAALGFYSVDVGDCVGRRERFRFGDEPVLVSFDARYLYKRNNIWDVKTLAS